MGTKLAILGSVVWFTGCAIPFVSIPSRVEVGGGLASGTLQDPAHPERAAADSADLFHFRAGLHPLQGVNALADRSFDVGAGYLFERASPESGRGFYHHGFYVEGTYFLVSHGVGERRLRWGLVGSGEYLFGRFNDLSDWGPGATLGTQLEWSGTTTTAFSKSSGGGLGSSAGVLGALYGEWAIGVALSGGVRHLSEATHYTVMAGLYARLPFGIGLAGISN